MALQDVLQETFCDKMFVDLTRHHEAIVELRAQMGVVLGGKIVEGSVVEVPKFLTKSANNQRDAIVERLADVERQTARIERQIKDALNKLAGERKADLIAEAMRRSLAKRVDKAEGSLKQIVTDLGETVERLRRLEHGV